MDERRPCAFHLLFRNYDLIQAARLLIRTHNMKKGTEYSLERLEKEVENGRSAKSNFLQIVPQGS
jgi:hypothetical protein